MALEFNINWNGNAVQEMVTANAVRGLNQAAAFLQARTVPRTPKDTGELRNSLVIQPAEPGRLYSAVGSNLAYAVRQHEELGYRHKHGEAKFLERTMHDQAPQLQRIIANNLNRKATS